MQSGPPEVSDTVNQLFQMYSPEVNLDQKKIVQAYCDSSANFNLLFITKIPEKRSGITMHEMSQDIFKTYSQVATATGGIAETTANLTVAVQDALKASEAYYLLSYTPASASKDGEFRTISVKVKDKDYKVLSRRGYIKG